VDYNQWNDSTTSAQLQSVKNVLWILEPMPGLVMSADVTHVLMQQGYWPSYNIPYFPQIYEYSGTEQMFQQYGDFFSYDNCSRANIFRRNQTLVSSFQGLKDLMRYNDYQVDPLSADDPSSAICARMDLEKQYAVPAGGIDSKVTSLERVFQMECDSQCAPTHDQQKPFQWSDWSDWPHQGMPDLYDFQWQTMNFKRV